MRYNFARRPGERTEGPTSQVAGQGGNINRHSANGGLADEREQAMTALKDRITIDSDICHGKPCIRGLRYPVEWLLELLSSGTTADQILEDYGDLERDDILAALEYAARLAQVKRILPNAAA